jgi:hypothetical protein
VNALGRLCTLLACLWPAGLQAQTFSKEGQLLVGAETTNTAAAQVAVAQARLFGSMLLSYRPGIRPGAPARMVIATRAERMVVEVDPHTFQTRLVRREETRNALPNGAIVCRSYAPIDAIVAGARRRFGNVAMEIVPPHLPGAQWRARIGLALHQVKLDDQGRAQFSAQRLSR